jgi:hypothetical protein
MTASLLLTLCLTATADDQPPPVLAPAPTPLPVVQVLMNHYEFAETFLPAPGNYRVTLIHPVSGCPVDVCFSLPCGCVQCVRATKRAVVFDYGGRHSVTIVFRVLGGGSRVDVVSR